jgi:hypothetical protein
VRAELEEGACLCRLRDRQQKEHGQINERGRRGRSENEQIWLGASMYMGHSGYLICTNGSCLAQNMALLGLASQLLCLACLLVEVLLLIVRNDLVQVDIMSSGDVVWRAVLESPVTWSACANYRVGSKRGETR